MRLIAIDPGTEKSAWVVLSDGDVLDFGIYMNEAMLNRLRLRLGSVVDTEVLAIEMVACYGMPVGLEVFETCVWTGRFIEAWGGPWHRVYRKDLKLHLCGTTRAKDKNVRAALIDRFGPGKAKAIGVKAKPGPLYKVSKDVWQALGVAVYFADEAKRKALVGSQVDVVA